MHTFIIYCSCAGITRDLKRRLETIHNWYGKSAKDSPPGPSNNNLFVSKRKYSDGVVAEPTKSKSSSMPKNIMKDIAPSVGWKMDTVQTATSLSSTTNNTDNNNEQQQRKSPREQPKQNYSAVLKHNPLPELNASITNQNQLLPTSNDIILSLYDNKYRNVIFSSFLELAKDESKKKEFAIQIFNNFKSMSNANCKFYKVERGGKAYVVVDDALALQSKLYIS